MSQSIEEIEAWLGAHLPAGYRAFLATQDETLPIGEVVLIYGRESLIERNETYETKMYCPGFITVGDDSGGRQILLSLHSGQITLVDAGAMSPEYAQSVADDFETWLVAEWPLPD